MSPASSRRRPAGLSLVNVGGIAVALAMTAAFYAVAVRPTMVHHQQVAAQRGQSKADAQKIAAVEKQLRQAQAEGAMLKAASSGPTLEPVEAINRRLAQIADLAVMRKLDLQEMRPGAATGAGRYVTLPITLTGVGTFRRCVDYLHDLHDQLPDVAITAASLNQVAGESEDSSAAHFELELRWYAAAPASLPAASPR